MQKRGGIKNKLRRKTILDNDGDTYIDLQDSKCVNSKDRDESPRDFCNDSDGINYLIQGTASGEDNSIPFSNTDFCVS